MQKVISTEVCADKTRKKQSVANTLAGANNDMGHFFLIKGEKNLVCSYIQIL